MLACSALTPLSVLAAVLSFTTTSTSANPLAPTPPLSPYQSDARPQLRFPGWPGHRSPAPRGSNQLHRDYSPYEGGEAAPELCYPGGASRNVERIKVHSHNDYWRDVPLFSALERGVTSIEADVWLNPKDSTLYVSHRRPLYLILSSLLGPLTPVLPLLSSLLLFLAGIDFAQVSHCVTALTRARTFRGLYVDPLVKLLEQANPTDREAGFFEGTDFFSPDNVREERRPWKGYWDTDEPITLLVDLKTRGDVTYEAVRRETEPLRRRGWLTRWDGEKIVPGPVRVVLTGNGNNLDVRRTIGALNETDLFIDAPLLSLNETWLDADGHNQTWSPHIAPLTSASFSSATKWNARQPISDSQFAALQGLFRSAQARGFETRLWSPPRWPTFARDRAWRTLLEAGVDWLDADDLDAVLAL